MYAKDQRLRLVKRSRTASPFLGGQGYSHLDKATHPSQPLNGHINRAGWTGKWPPFPSFLQTRFWFPRQKGKRQKNFWRTRRCFPGFSTPEHPSHAGLITHHTRLTATTGT
ncbi:uncharacterized protein AKAW2_20960A [Aspergillus luchuensis]|uniref:Uncharacterized protein n=1 Tax=Aspergillus kawachii TaxID=1069201 RepID=A0A7R7ZVG1_ASPKA|nr:uncharacterized protein AKAW2_20960A [Aspergillus luchuensis]BCR96020.1 hypothetical protein AKAW2_20960A [Aspergillus luchuensis]